MTEASLSSVMGPTSAPCWNLMLLCLSKIIRVGRVMSLRLVQMFAVSLAKVQFAP